MKNSKIIEVEGAKVPVANVRHWRYTPERIVPGRSDAETFRWVIFRSLLEGWRKLDAGSVLSVLADDFTYGSYWVKGGDLDLRAYKDYLPKKFETISRSGTNPHVDIVVLYEGLSLEPFPYALRIVQGSITCLLVVKFVGNRVASLYMTDPDIYTFEPTFPKGGITDDNGEPRVFVHSCLDMDRGRKMTAAEMQAFAVDCVTNLFKDANAIVRGVHYATFKEFPNVITRCGDDTFFHRLDVSNPENDGRISEEECGDYRQAAKANNAWPLVMPVSLFCADTGGADMICGGKYFIKVLEARTI